MICDCFGRKVVEVNGSDLIENTNLEYALRVWKKPLNLSFGMTGVWAEIWIWDLPNKTKYYTFNPFDRLVDGRWIEDTREEVVASYLSLKSRIFSESRNEEL
jgi:hypothetical protein